MARIFISHSSHNNAEAIAVRDWLIENGWEDLFLDLDPKRGIKAGERWQEALKAAVHHCEAVLFLISPDWVASTWCLAEFHQARKLNKRLFGVLIQHTPLDDLPTEMTAEWQLVDLSTEPRNVKIKLPKGSKTSIVAFSEDGLARIKIGLRAAGLDAKYFAWPPKIDPDRSPYRGLKPLEADDAGIFFGRDGAIVEALDRLRGLREAAPARMLVILGASGSGKSSFLRAGLLPRLARDGQHFFPLPVIRPERAVLTGETGLVASLTAAFKALGITRTRQAVLTAIKGGCAELRSLLNELVLASAGNGDETAKPPTLILSIDQGEELYLAEGAAEADRFMVLLKELLEEDPPAVMVVFTIRSDTYERLQLDERLENLRQQTMSLRPIPHGAYVDVITGPALRLEGSDRPLKIEEKLTDALLTDIEEGGAKDALPLLAFTMERLYTEYGEDGNLKLADYEDLGGIRGSIEAAVERALQAADAHPEVPKDRQARLALLRRGLIPWLAGIDPDSGAPRRRVARLSEIPGKSRPLIEHLVDQRLLATDISPATGEVTIEPAHEALLRQWRLLESWLDEDFEALTTLEGVKRAAREWEVNDRDAAWLAHAGGRLEASELVASRQDFKGLLSDDEYAYIIAARQADDLRQKAEFERQKKELEIQEELLNAQKKTIYRSKIIAVGSMASAVIVAILGWLMYGQWQIAEKNRALSEHNLGLALVTEAEAAMKTERPALAYVASSVAMGTQGIVGKASQTPFLAPGSDAFIRAETISRISGKAANFPDLIVKDRAAVYAVNVSPAGDKIAYGVQDNKISIIETKTGKLISRLLGHTDRINSIKFSPDGVLVATASTDNTIAIWNLKTNKVSTLCGHEGAVDEIAFHPNGKIIASAGRDGVVIIWDTQSLSKVNEFKNPQGSVQTVAFSADGQLLGYADLAGRITIRRTNDWSVVQVIAAPEKDIIGLAFNATGEKLVSATYAGLVRIWSLPDGESVARRVSHNDKLWRMRVLSDQRIATASWDQTVRLWDIETFEQLSTFDAHDHWVNDVAFSKDSQVMVTASEDGNVRVWGQAAKPLMFVTISDHDQGVRRGAYSADGQIFASGGLDQKVILYRMNDQNKPLQMCKPIAHAGWVTGIGLDPAGRILASAGTAAGAKNNVIRLTDTTSCKEISQISVGDLYITNLKMSPSGQYLAVTSRDRGVIVFDIASGKPISKFLQHRGEVKNISFHPTKDYIASAGVDNKIFIWKLKNAEIVQRLAIQTDEIWFLEFSPDGGLLASAGGETAIRIWDWNKNKPVTKDVLTPTTASGIMFSSDGRKLLVGDDDGSLSVWDTTKWRREAILSSLIGARGPLATHPSKQIFAFDGGNGVVRFWDYRKKPGLADLNQTFSLTGTKINFSEGSANFIDHRATKNPENSVNFAACR